MEDLFDRFQAITGISKYSNSELITPQNIVKDMVDLLPASVFNKEAEIYKRLMESQLMVQAFPEEQKRRQHIIDNQIYGFATSGIAATLVRRQLYDDPTLVKNIYFTTAKDIVKEIQGAFSNMKFEILSAVWIQSHDSSPLQAGG